MEKSDIPSFRIIDDGCMVRNVDASNAIMFSYIFFQTGLIFCSLVVGCCCLGHMLYCRSQSCQNFGLIFTVMITGLCYMVACAYVLDLTENAANIQIPRGGSVDCVDYTFPTTLTNAVVFAAISISIIRQNVTSSFGACFLSIATVLCMLAGLCKMSEDNWTTDSSHLHGDVLMTLGSSTESHMDVFWSICPKEITKTFFQLMLEYGLIYFPVLLTVSGGLYRSWKENKGLSILNLKIIKKGCGKDNARPCVCSKLNTAFVTIIIYSFLLLFIIRPIMIFYGYRTSGMFHDICPGLLSTVVFCFLCSEYIVRVWKIKIARLPIYELKKKGTCV